MASPARTAATPVSAALAGGITCVSGWHTNSMCAKIQLCICVTYLCSQVRVNSHMYIRQLAAFVAKLMSSVRSFTFGRFVVQPHQDLTAVQLPGL
jgi:acid phosphatase family membrane protein YuiD